MKGKQTAFGKVRIEKTNKGTCCELVENGMCTNSATIVIRQTGCMNKRYCDMHAKETWQDMVNDE